MHASVFIATSLDGFIAREDGAIDWLLSADGGDSAEPYGYREFFDSVDAVVMGRNTFELVRTFDEWPYGDKPLIVLSSRRLKIPPSLAETVSQAAGSPREVVRLLADRGFSRLYVDGGRTIRGFLREGLIDDLIITVIPVLLGRGIPLFGSLAADVHLRHVETHAFSNGFVQSRYVVDRFPDASIITKK
jgi:dihydrofolate reductase